ncbi:glycosyltransferase family 2 protein [Timonella senegalensis]|uniref:glycosyltransferase family 2 protein n=1 Tax=Timonella senegalensis TaxID=1465825 RepID=UPI0009D99A65|nr:glycosyltransferase family 2 protein [Timonella senegalensis]
MTQSSTAISVIIPTTGRASLSAAVASVRAQELAGAHVQLIVVVDSLDGLIPDDCPTPDLLLFTSGGKGGGYARQLGTGAATGEYISYLDDDDVWLPQKLQKQLDFHRAQLNERLVLGCQLTQDWGNQSSVAIPLRGISGNERIEDYLFRNRSPKLGRNSLFTSTIFLRTDLAQRVGWNPDLPRHQDWDFLFRLQEHESAVFSHVAEVLVRVFPDSEGSISASSDWQSSLNWYLKTKDAWNTNTRVDFLVSQTLRYALQSRSMIGAAHTVREVARTRSVPSFGNLLTGMGGILPKARAMRLLELVGRKK